MCFYSRLPGLLALLLLATSSLALLDSSSEAFIAGACETEGDLVEEDGVLLATRDVMAELDSNAAIIESTKLGGDAEGNPLQVLDWLWAPSPSGSSKSSEAKLATVPDMLRVISVNHHTYTSGVYKLVSDRLANAFPVWRDILDKENVIYSGASGEWFIGKDVEAKDGQSRGWIRSPIHNASSPDNTSGQWSYFDEKGHWSNHDAILVSAVESHRKAAGKTGIPKKLIIVTKHESFAQMQAMEPALATNVAATLNGNSDLRVMWLGDRGCKLYLEQVGETELAYAYSLEPRGAYRGDICRAVVLKNEGGFYTDVDLQLRRPLQDLVDENTNFMSSTGSFGGLLNAIIGTVAHGSVINEAVQQLKLFYRHQARPIPESMEVGPVTLIRAVEKVAWRQGESLAGANTDGQLALAQDQLEWNVGSDHFKIYREERIDCSLIHEPECPADRKAAFDAFDGARYGLFNPKNHDLVGWSRFASCREYGCHTGGRDGYKPSSSAPGQPAP